MDKKMDGQKKNRLKVYLFIIRYIYRYLMYSPL
jgi:hypothetical protein